MDRAEEINFLLKKIELIEFKYNTLRDIYQNSRDFNIFSILSDERNRTDIHSKFIYELLNPYGSHNQGDIFLKSFLETLSLNEFLEEEFAVYRGRFNIDILLLSDSKAIVIENRIYSKFDDHLNISQKNFNYVKEIGYQDEDIKVIQLTLSPKDGKSILSSLDGRNLIQISYQEHITLWLENLISIFAKIPAVREVLIQYLNLIENLLKRNSNKGFLMEVKELLQNRDNFKLALEIESVITDIKIETQREFWKKLIEYLDESGYKFKFYNSYGELSLEESVKRYYLEKDKGGDYGIEYLLYKDLYIFIELRDSIYYGFYFKDKKSKKDFDKSDLTMVEILDELGIEWKENYWKYPTKEIDFEKFNENALELLDSEKLEKSVKLIADEVMLAINSFKIKALEKGLV